MKFRSLLVVSLSGISYWSSAVVLLWTVEGPTPPHPTSMVEGALEKNVTEIKQMPPTVADLVHITELIRTNKPKELKDFLAKAQCNNKLQYKEYITRPSGSTLEACQKIGVGERSMLSLILVSWSGCQESQLHVGRMRFALSRRYTLSTRYITEVLVTVSESAELHDEFLKFYNADTIWGVGNLDADLEWKVKDDIKNVCFELKSRKRAAPDTQIDAPKLAGELDDEKGKWNNKRGHLDQIIMETPLEKLRLVFDEFKKINDDKPIEETITHKFEDDINKQTAYSQLVGLARDKASYFGNEIQARITLNEDFSLPLANAIVLLGTLEKADRDRIYTKPLQDQLAKLMVNFDAVVQELLKLYMEDLKK